LAYLKKIDRQNEKPRILFVDVENGTFEYSPKITRE
jgi:hypothetical protein